MSQSSCVAAMLKDMIIQDTLCMTTSFKLFTSILIGRGFISWHNLQYDANNTNDFLIFDSICQWLCW